MSTYDLDNEIVRLKLMAEVEHRLAHNKPDILARIEIVKSDEIVRKDEIAKVPMERVDRMVVRMTKFPITNFELRSQLFELLASSLQQNMALKVIEALNTRSNLVFCPVANCFEQAMFKVIVRQYQGIAAKDRFAVISPAALTDLTCDLSNLLDDSHIKFTDLNLIVRNQLPPGAGGWFQRRNFRYTRKTLIGRRGSVDLNIKAGSDRIEVSLSRPFHVRIVDPSQIMAFDINE